MKVNMWQGKLVNGIQSLHVNNLISSIQKGIDEVHVTKIIADSPQINEVHISLQISDINQGRSYRKAL